MSNKDSAAAAARQSVELPAEYLIDFASPAVDPSCVLVSLI